MEISNSLSVGCEDLSLGLLWLTIVFTLVYFLTFDTHNAHEVISRVAEFWAFESDGFEMSNSQSGLIEIDDSTLSEEHQSIKHLEDVGVWLMDSTDDCSACQCKISQDFHDSGGCEGIQTSSRLIQEDEVRICDQLNTDGCSLSLSS